MAGFLAIETCRWLEMVEELDRTHAWSGWGVKSCAHWWSWACSLSPGTAREHVRVARSPAAAAADPAGVRRRRVVLLQGPRSQQAGRPDR